MDRNQQLLAFLDWKERFVTSIATSCQFLTLLLNTMDQISEATFQPHEVLAHTPEGSVLDPQVRDSIRMGDH